MLMFHRVLALAIGWLIWGIVVFLVYTMIYSPLLLDVMLAPFALLMSLLALRFIADAVLGD